MVPGPSEAGIIVVDIVEPPPLGSDGDGSGCRGAGCGSAVGVGHVDVGIWFDSSDVLIEDKY